MSVVYEEVLIELGNSLLFLNIVITVVVVLPNDHLKVVIPCRPIDKDLFEKFNV